MKPLQLVGEPDSNLCPMSKSLECVQGGMETLRSPGRSDPSDTWRLSSTWKNRSLRGRLLCHPVRCQGSSSSRFEKGASAILAVQVDDATGGRAKQARVPMGEEPAHFLNMMDGNFITLQGGVARKKPTVQDKDGVMLFKVESQCNSVGSKKPLVRTNQVDETVSSLNNEDAFILLDMNKKSVFTWAARGSSAEEKSRMASVA